MDGWVNCVTDADFWSVSEPQNCPCLVGPVFSLSTLTNLQHVCMQCQTGFIHPHFASFFAFAKCDVWTGISFGTDLIIYAWSLLDCASFNFYADDCTILWPPLGCQIFSPNFSWSWFMSLDPNLWLNRLYEELRSCWIISKLLESISIVTEIFNTTPQHECSPLWKHSLVFALQSQK